MNILISITNILLILLFCNYVNSESPLLKVPAKAPTSRHIRKYPTVQYRRRLENDLGPETEEGFVAPTAPLPDTEEVFVAPTAPIPDPDPDPATTDTSSSSSESSESSSSSSTSTSTEKAEEKEERGNLYKDVLFVFNSWSFILAMCVMIIGTGVIVYIRCMRPDSIRWPDEKAVYSQLSVFDPMDDDTIDEVEMASLNDE